MVESNRLRLLLRRQIFDGYDMQRIDLGGPVILTEHHHHTFTHGHEVVVWHFEPSTIRRDQGKWFKTVLQLRPNVVQVHVPYFARGRRSGKRGKPTRSRSPGLQARVE